MSRKLTALGAAKSIRVEIAAGFVSFSASAGGNRSGRTKAFSAPAKVCAEIP
uniref:hypothetical protein n=1 Tax=uncultured Rhizobium sp. TaxID=155567 RepID=UPI00260695DA|nr:hypothetical protein [uncultured Rhizobium sp.]